MATFILPMAMEKILLYNTTPKEIIFAISEEMEKEKINLSAVMVLQLIKEMQ